MLQAVVLCQPMDGPERRVGPCADPVAARSDDVAAAPLVGRGAGPRTAGGGGQRPRLGGKGGGGGGGDAARAACFVWLHEGEAGEAPEAVLRGVLKGGRAVGQSLRSSGAAEGPLATWAVARLRRRCRPLA